MYPPDSDPATEREQPTATVHVRHRRRPMHRVLRDLRHTEPGALLREDALTPERDETPGAWTCTVCGFRGFWDGGAHCIGHDGRSNRERA